MEEEKERDCSLSWWGGGVTLVRLKTRDCKKFALEIHEKVRKTKEV